MTLLAVLSDQIAGPVASPLASMVTNLVTSLVVLADGAPEPEDVKAGWTAFVVFLLLLVAVALLGWSLSRQLKKAERNKEAGILPSSKKERQGHAPQA